MTASLDAATDWSPARLAAIRQELRSRSLDALIIPRFDAHLGEYCAPHDDRLAWSTGFCGSAGVAIIAVDGAALFVDGRYTVQVREETSNVHFEYAHLNDEPPDDWIRKHAKQNWRIGFDALHIPTALHDKLNMAANAVGTHLVLTDSNVIDAVWDGQPISPLGPISAFPVEFAGETSASKRDRLCRQMQDNGINLLVETQPDNIAWLLNVRGSDVTFNPFPQSCALVSQDGSVQWFVDARKLPNQMEGFELQGVRLASPEGFVGRLAELAKTGINVSIDPDATSVACRHAIENAGGKVKLEYGPIGLMKAHKNSVELAGMRACHLDDAVAMVRFLAWLDREVLARELAGQPITELEARDRLLEFRQCSSSFVFPSFNTISAAGAHAAMSHYAVTPSSNAPITSQTVYLIDSGGQYRNGTTDITRTIAFGPMSEEVRIAYTLVLKGQISLSILRFPAGTKGHQIDAFARRALWDHGMDYDHGTGHGVGHFLSVHEKPHRLAKTVNPFDLRPATVVTNEPGYYKEGSFGIRTENLLEIVEDQDKFLSFRSLTQVPIDTRLIDQSMMLPQEITWLNDYHRQVWALIGYRVPLVDRAWLEEATKPI